jgi:predicted alpha/beta-hydrolase family hydrolase
MDITTGAGPARVWLDNPADEARFLLVLTHGAGGGADTADVLAARQAGLACGGAVARVLQPYRVAGARAPGSALRQDAAWLEIIAALRARYGVPVVQGGRSNGARVACRTAEAAGAVAAIALAFPLHPPGKADQPDKSRAGELRSAGVPVLVINGENDPFGVPAAEDADHLVVLPGETHSLSRHPAAVTAAVASWLASGSGRGWY